MKTNSLMTMAGGLALCLALTICPPVARGVETSGDNTEPTVSTLANPTQVAKAVAVAEEAAGQAAAAVAAAEADLEAAEAKLAGLDNTAPPQAIAAAREAIDDAEAALEAAIAREAMVAQSDIAAMRADGMGWGEIAHELGIHPGVLGLGHTKQQQSTLTARTRTRTEDAAGLTNRFTHRNIKSDPAAGSSNPAKGSKALGLGHSSGKALGHGDSKGQSQGSHAGGNGKGKGGGSGGGNGGGGGKGGGGGRK